MSQKIAYDGTPTNYVFPLPGRRILAAPVNTAKPATVVPIYDTTLPVAPAGWADLGMTVDANVTMSVDFTTAKVVTGTIGNVRRIYIDSQTGKISAQIYAWEPAKMATITGQGSVVTTASTSLNRAFKSLGLGGTLGNKLAVLVFEDFDIPLVEDAVGGSTYEQLWAYSPTVQRTASINLSEEVTKVNVVTFDYELLPYTNAAYTGRSILIELNWLSI